MQRIREPSKYFRLLFHIQKLIHGRTSNTNFIVTVEAIDLSSNETFQKNRLKERNLFINDYSFRYFMGMEGNNSMDVEYLIIEDIENALKDLLYKNKDKQITKTIRDCLDKRKLLNDDLVKKLFRYFSISGKVDEIILLQQYCQILNPVLYIRNGEFLHYAAKGQCMKGNSEKGLSILKEAYSKYEGLRNFYRIIFNELINDSVQNRSEASLVIFKQYVLEFSNTWNDHYPLICFWHICWSSSWFSDQMTSENLLETSKVLQDIIRDKATTFSINILKEYNEDAVIRLLQSLLKYKMMVEYTKVLEILFSFKLRNKDLRGCTEILKNCQTLGISLPSYQQGKYLKMFINNQEPPDSKPKLPQSNNFKLKF